MYSVLAFLQINVISHVTTFLGTLHDHLACKNSVIHTSSHMCTQNSAILEALFFKNKNPLLFSEIRSAVFSTL